MRRALFFAIAGMNVGCMLIQLVILAFQIATAAPVSRTAVTMLWLLFNATAAAWTFSVGTEADR